MLPLVPTTANSAQSYPMPSDPIPSDPGAQIPSPLSVALSETLSLTAVHSLSFLFTDSEVHNEQDAQCGRHIGGNETQ